MGLYFRVMRQSFLCLLLFISATPAAAESTPERDFIMSCTYGVMAGTLVGAASLAFVDKPGENLQYVARGASIGLYIGIGLGLYTAYVLPKQLQKEEEEKLDSASGEEYSSLPRWFVFPLVSENGIDGAGALWQVARF